MTVKTTPWTKIRICDPDAGWKNRPIILTETRDPITMDLPMPPSVNALYRNRSPAEMQRGKGRIKTQVYKIWLAEASYRVRTQVTQCVKHRYVLDVLVPRQSHADIGNLEKAISDLLQKEKVIKNDKLCEGISIFWNDDIDAVAVTVWPWPISIGEPIGN